MKFNESRYHDPQRRRFLAQVAAGGLMSAGAVDVILAMARLPENQGFHELVGEVLVNGAATPKGAVVVPGDTIETGSNSHAVYIVGRSAFLQRENSRVELAAPARTVNNAKDGLVVHALRMLTGKLLSVHARGERAITTSTGIIGIRGTGLYVDAQPDRTYACICYGKADLSAVDGGEIETVRTRHHESPRFIYPVGASRRIEPAPVIDHTDEELILLETLVNREPPFVNEEGGGNY